MSGSRLMSCSSCAAVWQLPVICPQTHQGVHEHPLCPYTVTSGVFLLLHVSEPFSCGAEDCPQSSRFFSAPLWAQEVLLFSAKWRKHGTKSLSGFSFAHLCTCGCVLIVKLVKIPAFITYWCYRQSTLKC